MKKTTKKPKHKLHSSIDRSLLELLNQRASSRPRSRSVSKTDQSYSSMKHLEKASRVLASHSKLVLEQKLPQNVKQELSKHIKKLSHCLEYVRGSYQTGESRQMEEFKQKTISTYKEHLSSIINQTQALKDKLNQMENATEMKNIVEDQEYKISVLTQEKEILNTHIKSLQSSLNEQNIVIDNLKALINNVEKNSPPRSSIPSRKTESPDIRTSL